MTSTLLSIGGVLVGLPALLTLIVRLSAPTGRRTGTGGATLAARSSGHREA